MNKIFKIVYNAARAKMMVVNETTSSVQTGKKAAVTVAVAGALLSFVGSANAYWVADGQTVVITDNQTVTLDGVAAQTPIAEGDTVLGGVSATGEGAVGQLKNINTSITMNGGKTKDVIGGHYVILGHQSDESKVTEGGNVKLGNLSVEINGGEVTRSVIGGNKIGRNSVNGNFEYTHKNLDENGNFVSGVLEISTASTNVVINDGKFGTSASQIDEYTAPLNMIVAGDLVKDIGWAKVKTVSTIDSVNMTINGGTFDAPVIGGSYGILYADFHSNIELNVGESNLTINGGTFNQPVIAGSAMYVTKETYSATNNYQQIDPCDTVLHLSEYAKAATETANTNILGGTFSDIYTGGVVLYADEQYVTNKNADATIGTSNVDINGATVKNVYAKTAYSQFDSASGKWTFDKAFSDGTGSAVNTNLKLTNATVTGEVDVQKGSVELRVEGANGKTKVRTLNVDEKNTEVRLTADGEANDALGGDIMSAIDVTDGLKTATVAMEEGMTEGAVTGKIEGGVAKVSQATNSVMSNVLDLASASTLSMNRILMNDVRKRLGDLRSSEGTHGVWARYDGGELSGSHSLENDFTTIQVGIDTVPSADAPRFGVAFAYTKSDADMKRGDAEMDAFSLAFYGTKMYDNGMFVDVIGRMATADTDVTVDGTKKGSMDNIALSLSGEFGWRFDVTDTFYVEPQTELTYTYVDADTLKLSNGTSYEFDSVDSLIARAGFAAGLKCPDNFGDVYVRASAVHEFLGDAAVSAGRSTLELDGDDTWIEFGIGANFNINKSTYVYADIESTQGAELDEDWRANIGVRYAF